MGRRFKTETVKVRISDKEKRLAAEAAQADELTLSEFIRQAVRREVQQAA